MRDCQSDLQVFDLAKDAMRYGKNNRRDLNVCSVGQGLLISIIPRSSYLVKVT